MMFLPKYFRNPFTDQHCSELFFQKEVITENKQNWCFEQLKRILNNDNLRIDFLLTNNLLYYIQNICFAIDYFLSIFIHLFI